MKEPKLTAWDYVRGTLVCLVCLPIVIPYIVITSFPLAWTLANLEEPQWTKPQKAPKN